MKRLALVLASLTLQTCAPAVCARYCPNLQTVVLVNSAGEPLTPKRAVDSHDSHDCVTDAGVADDFVTCDGNRITFDQHFFGAYTLRVEATTGEVFNAEFTPQREPTGMESMGCDCVKDMRFVDQTLTLVFP
ncbi:MAG: hypothetical protein ACO1OB_14580 [Archangium sp.]